MTDDLMPKCQSCGRRVPPGREQAHDNGAVSTHYECECGSHYEIRNHYDPSERSGPYDGVEHG